MTNQLTRRVGQLTVLAAAAAVPSLIFTPTAHAGPVGQVHKSGAELQFQAGKANDTIVVSAGKGTYVFTDTVAMTAGPGCWRGASAKQIVCGNGGITKIEIWGGDGNDRITSKVSIGTVLSGQNGTDRLYGGPGRDLLSGGPGADLMYGGGGEDAVGYGYSAVGVRASLDNIANDGAANEHDFIGPDVEDLYGSNHGDVLVGNAKANVLLGFGGNDTLGGGAGNDTVRGDAGNDKVYGDAGVDDLFGGTGNDYLFGGTGVVDFLHGDAGLDLCTDPDLFTLRTGCE